MKKQVQADEIRIFLPNFAPSKGTVGPIRPIDFHGEERIAFVITCFHRISESLSAGSMKMAVQTAFPLTTTDNQKRSMKKKIQFSLVYRDM